ncbi:hypothetical protein D3C78_1552540 [compost metagenome]
MHGGETGLAHDALEHHAAAYAHAHSRGFEGFGVLLGMRGLDGSGMVRGLEVVGEGHTTALGLGFAQAFELFAALGDQLVFVLRGGGIGCGSGVVVRHEKSASGQALVERGQNP